jgi:predicted PurR-regulated permease PerM
MVSRPRLGSSGAHELPGEELGAGELPPAPPAPLVIPRGVQLVLLLVALLALWVAARAAKHVVEIIVVASFLALVLNPFVEFLGRRGIRRGLAIPLAYVSLLLLLAGIGLALSQPISNQIDAFQHNFPHLVHEANQRLNSVQKFFNKHGIHIQLRKQGHTALQTIQSKVLKSSSSILSFTTSLLTSAASAAISLVLIFVMSVYLLIYARSIGALVRRWLPPGDGTPEDDYPSRVR